MRSVLLTVVIALFVTACDPVLKEEEVPQVVRTAFATKYPDATQIEWERENKEEYEVEFYLGDKKREALFNQNGSFVKEERAR